ncbi:glucan endo-1,3-beta-D-glucosidase [Flavobacterium sp. ALD4]|jgi:hypothetical protein|uniref:glucan endo-1,3-beta-D-glucosidase n=1 Tax=Flavobacterium sp. ALD4 TaxID=2058314 RepID=UPI000C343F0E|nr:glucan endo-1,3-beta-D-glucosidase [Flavobacterium sp. ALD4]PKH67415.1 glucan endo-1,3-beta-D-glucosidase [Flavobacterium sp. ALD4]
MKNIKHIVTFLFIALVFSSCTEENYEFGDIVTPTGLTITPEIVGANADNPYGDGSGVVNINATANNAISYKFIYNGQETVAPSGKLTYNFGNTGVRKYTITVVANGTAGVSTSTTIELEVSVVYLPPAELVTTLTSNSSRRWRIKAEAKPHFGLGPLGGTEIADLYFSAEPNDKADSGMYDDRFTFNVDGTFLHDTGIDGFVFGREVLIEELNGPGGIKVGQDFIQYPYPDQAGQYILSAPNNVETISLSGLGFIGYYVGGNHQYRILSRSANELILTTGDGNGELEWWFVLVPE